MPSAAASQLHLVPGVPTLGLWCPTCLLPSGYDVRVYAFTDHRTWLVGTDRRCYDCGTPLPAGA
jgi:hypothetical protein